MHDNLFLFSFCHTVSTIKILLASLFFFSLIKISHRSQALSYLVNHISTIPCVYIHIYPYIELSIFSYPHPTTYNN